MSEDIKVVYMAFLGGFKYLGVITPREMVVHSSWREMYKRIGIEVL